MFFEDDREALTSAIALACTQWGGKSSILVPINKELDTWPIIRHMLRVHPPDRFCYFHKDKPVLHDRRADLIRICQYEWGLPSASVSDGNYYIDHDYSVHAIRAARRILNQGATLFTPEIQNVRSKLPLQHGLYGVIYEGQESTYQNQFRLEKTVVDFDSPGYWKMQTAHSPLDSILNLTCANLAPLRVEGGGLVGDPVFQIVVGEDLADLAFFWNIRTVREDAEFHQTHRRMLFMPAELISAEQVSRIAHVIRSAPIILGATSTHDVEFYVQKNELREQLLSAIKQSRALNEYKGERLGTEYSIGESSTKPTREADPGRELIYVVNQPIIMPSQYQLQGGGRSQERLVDLEDGQNTIEYSLPKDFPVGSGDIMLDISCNAWDRYLPSVRIAERIIKGTKFTHYGLSGSYSVHGDLQTLKIDLVSPWEGFEEYLKTKGYCARLSRPGRYGLPIINRLGGLDGLNILADMTTHKILSLLTVQSTKKIAQRLFRHLSLADDEGENLVRALGEYQVNAEMRKVAKTCDDLRSAIEGVKREDIVKRLTALVESDLVRRGILLDCPKCGMPAWYGVGRIDEEIRCDGCGDKYLLPVARESGGELVLQYVLNTLMNRVMDQDVLPHMLALNCCARIYSIEDWTVGVELLKAGSDIVETEYDISFIEKQCLHFGECKVGGLLSDNDIQAVHIAADLGAKTFTFSSINGFSEDARRKIAGLRTELGDSPLKNNIRVLEGDILYGGEITAHIKPPAWMQSI